MEFAAQERTDPDAQAWFLLPSKDVQSDDPQIVALATQLTEGIDNTYEKALAIHDWVCNNISYDLDYINGAREYGDFSASFVYTEKQTVCLGFANFTAALLRAAGIPAKVVKGYAKGLSVKEEYPDEVFQERKTNHAWNEFYADGCWHAMDTTWDCGNTMEYGEVTGNLGCEGRNYFDPGPEWFAETHALVKCADLVEHTYYVDYSYMYERRSGAWYAYSDDGAVPYLEDGRTMIPLASAVRFLDGSLVWDEEANPGWITLSCQILGRRVCLFVGYPVFYVDGVAYCFAQAPVLKDGHVRVEARAFFSAIGCDVRWDGRTEWGKGAVTVSYEELL